MSSANSVTGMESQSRRTPEHSVTVSVRPLFTNVFGKLMKTKENDNKSYALNVHNIGRFETFCTGLESFCRGYKSTAKDGKMMWHFEEPYDAKDPADQLFRAQKALEEYRIPDHDKKIMLLLRLPRDVRGEYMELIVDTGSFSEFGQKLIEAVGMPEAPIAKKVSDKGKKPDTGGLPVYNGFSLDDALKSLGIIDDDNLLDDIIQKSIPKAASGVKFGRFTTPRAKTCLYCQSTEHLKMGCQLLDYDLKAKRVKLVNGIVCYLDGRSVPINARGGGMVAIIRARAVAGISGSNSGI
ncbi:hypothetical protein LPJ53_005459 [Coemansia erecta]|uniref:Uncharacterized protein n=1 Tax=Coemansia erecta TaxID=147472 RepID=A0A9W7XSF0_9FUNG|nr:hypothetical protein LPJ53_005459 [Coemansia erecta]